MDIAIYGHGLTHLLLLRSSLFITITDYKVWCAVRGKPLTTPPPMSFHSAVECDNITTGPLQTIQSSCKCLCCHGNHHAVIVQCAYIIPADKGIRELFWNGESRFSRLQCKKDDLHLSSSTSPPQLDPPPPPQLHPPPPS